MAHKRSDPAQPSLFGPDADESLAPRLRTGSEPAAAVHPPQRIELGQALSPLIHLGTSSWSFPGWRSIVWRDCEEESTLSRAGLHAYAAHPLLRCVGVDRTYYRPIDAEAFLRMAAQVPPHFRFLVKAHEAVTRPSAGNAVFGSGPSLLFDAAYAAEQVIAPAVEGLADRLGPLLFQLSPMGLRGAAEAESFIRRLGEFLGRLPAGPLYAVEARDRALMRASWAAMLRDTGVVHCFNAHPSQHQPLQQARLVEPASQRALVARWMLHSDHTYEGAVDRYAPFGAIVDEDPMSCSQFARLCVDAAGAMHSTFVIINNKAEGCAPLSAERLAYLIVAQSSRSPSTTNPDLRHSTETTT
jgi:uncharacterized protein YecE (DUF72 family)